LLLLCLSFLQGCGPEPSRLNGQLRDQSAFNGALNTQAQNEHGTLFTGFSPRPAFLELKEQIPLTEGNRDLARNIESVHSAVKNNILSIYVRWSKLVNPLQFQAPLVETNGKMAFDAAQDLSMQISDLKMSASCESAGCEVISAVLVDAVGNRVGFIHRNERRTLNLKVPGSQEKNIQLLPVSKQQILRKAQHGREVNVSSTEIIPGKSTFEISLNDSANDLIKGNLLSTNAGSTHIDSAGLFAELGSGELIGNNNEGELIFKYSQGLEVPAGSFSTGIAQTQPESFQKPAEVVSYLVLEPRVGEVTGSAPKPVQPNRQQGQLAEASHPLLKQILADQERDELKQYIDKYVSIHEVLTKDGNSAPKIGSFYSSVKTYVACHLGQVKGCGIDKSGIDRSKNVKKMVQILAHENLPAAMTMISMIESEFNSFAASPRGALGWWQFMPETARGYGLKVDPTANIDERKNLEKSTKAAARMLKELLIGWKGDLKMSLASYNFGEEGLRRICSKRTDSMNCRAGSYEIKFSEMQDLLEISKNDFWKFYRTNFLPKETQNYVMKFLSGNIIALNPQAYGFESPPLNLN
jgi:hypothetical protein